MTANNLDLPCAILIVASMCGLSCSQRPRPAAVTPAAVWVASAKTGYWQNCFLKGSNQVYCTVWNESGTVLMHEAYLPVDGGIQPVADELSVSDHPSSGPYNVWLKNGRILVPRSMFDREKDRFRKKR